MVEKIEVDETAEENSAPEIGIMIMVDWRLEKNPELLHTVLEDIFGS